MDFFSIFQNNKENTISNNENVVKGTLLSNENVVKGTNKKIKKKQSVLQASVNEDNDNQAKSIKKVESDSIKKDIYNTTLYKNIKKGDIVKIIGVKDSFLNIYKGYIGEIKDYKRDQDYALVFLHPIITSPIVKFPINHFVLQEFVDS